MPPDETNHNDLEPPVSPVPPESSPPSDQPPDSPIEISQPFPDNRDEDEVYDSPESDAEKPHADLDVCPNCGEPMPQRDQLVCLQCGFDLKTLKIIDIETGVEEITVAGEEKCLSQPGRGNRWLPGGLAAGAALLLLIGYFAGAGGLYPEPSLSGTPDATASILWIRFIGVIRFLVSTLLWTGCGVAGLFFTAHLMKKRVGDLGLAVTRLIALVLAARLIQFFDYAAHPTVEYGLEIALAVVVFSALAVALFRLSLRNAGTLALATTLSFLLLWGASSLVVWLT